MLYNVSMTKRDGVVPNRQNVRCGSIQTIIQRQCQICKICKLHVSSWNVGTMGGRASEVVETIGRRRINICCVQESRWNGCSARLISAKGFRFKFIWSRDILVFGGVGVLLNENWIDKVISVVRLNHRIMSVPILEGQVNCKHCQCLCTPSWFISC